MLVEIENVFFNWGHFLQLGAFYLKVGGKKLFWDRENQLFWELYGPLVKYPCSYCDYIATPPSYLKNHVESIHIRVRYPCPECEFTATRASNLKIHVDS